MFLRQYQRERKCFLSERELKKALRDTLTRAAWSSNFLLVRSEHAHASYPGLFFRPSGFSPYIYGAGRKESSGTGLVNCSWDKSPSLGKERPGYEEQNSFGAKKHKACRGAPRRRGMFS